MMMDGEEDQSTCRAVIYTYRVAIRFPSLNNVVLYHSLIITMVFEQERSRSMSSLNPSENRME
jgi:hypothetical protein